MTNRETMASSTYRPHPLERHFATHLLRLQFGDTDAVSSIPGSDDMEGDVCLRGRDAVPFLTNVRSSWSF